MYIYWFKKTKIYIIIYWNGVIRVIKRKCFTQPSGLHTTVHLIVKVPIYTFQEGLIKHTSNQFKTYR